MIELRGLTWAHTRGFAPLAALGRVWEDFHPEERVSWTARSLWSFGEEPLERYLDEYDLLVFDYPFAGEAIERGWVVPLEGVLDAATLEARRAGTIGPLHDAFAHHGAQSALAIDVATHVAAARPDLMAGLGEDLPGSWEAVLSLARRTGRVVMPLRPTGVWGAFLSLCAHRGDTPFRRADGTAFDMAVAVPVLEGLTELAALLPGWCRETYPVALLNRMATEDTIAYVPLTYGYSTYGLEGYAPHRLAFHPLPGGGGHGRGAILGGAGIGISARSAHREAAARHIAWLTSARVQSTLYVAFGGQPASRAAWFDPRNDAATGGFFGRVRESAEHPYVRPNAPGFHDFQNLASRRLHRAVTDGEAATPALREVATAWCAMAEARAP